MTEWPPKQTAPKMGPNRSLERQMASIARQRLPDRPSGLALHVRLERRVVLVQSLLEGAAHQGGHQLAEPSGRLDPSIQFQQRPLAQWIEFVTEVVVD